jgi:hypothetical protein
VNGAAEATAGMLSVSWPQRLAHFRLIPRIETYPAVVKFAELRGEVAGPLAFRAGLAIWYGRMALAEFVSRHDHLRAARRRLLVGLREMCVPFESV